MTNQLTIPMDLLSVDWAEEEPLDIDGLDLSIPDRTSPLIALLFCLGMIPAAYVFGRAQGEKQQQPTSSAPAVPIMAPPPPEGVVMNAAEVNSQRVTTWEVILLGKDGRPSLKVRAGDAGKLDVTRLDAPEPVEVRK